MEIQRGLQEEIAKLTLEETKSERAVHLRAELAKSSRLLDEVDLSLEGFLGEVAALLDIHTDLSDRKEALKKLHRSLTVERVRQVCKEQMEAAQPQQILMGDPLHTAGSFIGEVLCSLGETYESAKRMERKLKVVSIIGAQSSAKSTLLNFLFGCGFATRAGRCTKGLYASLLTYTAPGGGVDDERSLLVLDSEGLMSVTAGDNVFDQQITLLCLACSHLVIVNHKGEISRTLQNLMEVALWALGELRVLKVRPKIVFVLRDQNDFRDAEVHRVMLGRMKEALKDAATEAKQELHELLDLQEDRVFLMPAAFCMRKEFAERALQLRGKIFEWLEGVDSSSTAEFASLSAWHIHCSSIFDTLVKVGANLLNFEALHEVRMVQKVKELVSSLSNEVVNNPGDGLQDCLQTLVQNLESRIGGMGNVDDEGIVDNEQRGFVRESESARRRHLQILEEKFDERAAALEAKESILQRFRPQLETAVDRSISIATEAANRIVKSARERQKRRSLEEGFQQKLRDAGCLTTQNGEAQAESRFRAAWRALSASVLQEFKGSLPSPENVCVALCQDHHSVIMRRSDWKNVFAIESRNVTPCVVDREISFPDFHDADSFADDFLQPATWFSRPGEQSIKKQQAWEVFKEEFDCLLANCDSIEEEEMRRMGTGGNPSDMTQRVLERAYEDAEKTTRNGIPERLRKDTFFQLQTGSNHHLLQCTRFAILVRLARGRCKRYEAEIEEKKRQIAAEGETRLAAHLDLVRVSRDSLQLARRYAEKLFESASREVLDTSVNSIALRVSTRVQAEMPDACASCQKAFNLSFEKRDLPECVKFVLCPDLYIDDLFDASWEKLQTREELQQLPALVDTLRDKLGTVSDLFHAWAELSAEGPRPLSRVIAEMPSDQQERFTGVRACLPIDFSAGEVVVSDPKVFAEELSREIKLMCIEEPGETGQEDGGGLESACLSHLCRTLLSFKATAKSSSTGCVERCPFCNARCQEIGEHRDHICSHHLLGAFFGTRQAETNTPHLAVCNTKATMEDEWKRGDFDSYRPFFEHLEKYYPSWLKGFKETTALDAAISSQAVKEVWMRSRRFFLEFFDMVDSVPPDMQRFDNQMAPQAQQARMEVVEKSTVNLLTSGPEGNSERTDEGMAARGDEGDRDVQGDGNTDTLAKDRDELAQQRSDGQTDVHGVGGGDNTGDADGKGEEEDADENMMTGHQSAAASASAPQAGIFGEGAKKSGQRPVGAFSVSLLPNSWEFWWNQTAQCDEKIVPNIRDHPHFQMKDVRKWPHYPWPIKPEIALRFLPEELRGKPKLPNAQRKNGKSDLGIEYGNILKVELFVVTLCAVFLVDEEQEQPVHFRQAAKQLRWLASWATKRDPRPDLDFSNHWDTQFFVWTAEHQGRRFQMLAVPIRFSNPLPPYPFPVGEEKGARGKYDRQWNMIECSLSKSGLGHSAEGKKQEWFPVSRVWFQKWLQVTQQMRKEEGEAGDGAGQDEGEEEKLIDWRGPPGRRHQFELGHQDMLLAVSPGYSAAATAGEAVGAEETRSPSGLKGGFAFLSDQGGQGMQPPPTDACDRPLLPPSKKHKGDREDDNSDSDDHGFGGGAVTRQTSMEEVGDLQVLHPQQEDTIKSFTVATNRQSSDDGDEEERLQSRRAARMPSCVPLSQRAERPDSGLGLRDTDTRLSNDGRRSFQGPGPLTEPRPARTSSMEASGVYPKFSLQGRSSFPMAAVPESAPSISPSAVRAKTVSTKSTDGGQEDSHAGVHAGRGGRGGMGTQVGDLQALKPAAPSGSAPTTKKPSAVDAQIRQGGAERGGQSG